MPEQESPKHVLSPPRSFLRTDTGQGLFAVAVALLALCGFTLINKTVAADPNAKPIDLSIDYGDGVEKRIVDLKHVPDMTIVSLLKAAQEHSHGITYVLVGTGQNAFVTQIDDVKNEGGGPKSRNWMFRVNGKDADRGVGVFPLSPGDHVLWKFAIYEYNPTDQ